MKTSDGEYELMTPNEPHTDISFQQHENGTVTNNKRFLTWKSFSVVIVLIVFLNFLVIIAATGILFYHQSWIMGREIESKLCEAGKIEPLGKRNFV